MEVRNKEVLKELWVSKKRFIELEEKVSDIKSDYERFKRIMKYSKDGEITEEYKGKDIDNKFYNIDPESNLIDDIHYVYYEGEEYYVRIHSGYIIYKLEKIKSYTIKIKCVCDTESKNPKIRILIAKLDPSNKNKINDVIEVSCKSIEMK